MEINPESQEILPVQVKVCTARTEQHWFACNTRKIKLLSVSWRLNKSQALVAPSFHILVGKKLSFCQQIVEMLMKFLQENRKQSRQHKQLQNLLPLSSTFYSFPKSSLVWSPPKACFSISQFAGSVASLISVPQNFDFSVQFWNSFRT